MKRRDFIALLGGATVWPLTARALPERMRRIGVLMVWPESDPEARAQIAAFREGLQSFGWGEGRNITLDVRWSSAEVPMVQRLAKDLTDLRPDVFLATGTPAVDAILRATRIIPIVFTQVTDPVAQGLVKSLERPGSSMTGITIFEPEIGGKWLQVLKEVAPTSKRAAVIFNPDTAPYYPLYMRSIEAAAAALDMKVFEAPSHNQADIEAVLRGLARDSGGGVIVMSDLFAFVHRDLIVALTARYRLPAVYPIRAFVKEGGLISYGVDLNQMQRRAATFVDRILQGANPADLPVELPIQFVLAINQSTAKTLGLDIPLTLLTRAEEVID
jgi:putative tryptophan/tyrosine transport system substrate-binding protein